MSTVEVAYALEPFADYLIASAEIEPFAGWYYDGSKVSDCEWDIEGNVTLVANWNGIPYTENSRTYVNLGRYPQTVVTDETIIEALSNISTINELGYIEYNGNEYKKVVAKPLFSDYTFSNGNTIVEGNTYYFLVEPICWRILNNPQSNELFLISEEILDSKAFNNISSSVTIDGVVIRPSDYEYSTIRKWLNEVFYNKAFNDEFKSYIQRIVRRRKCRAFIDRAGGRAHVWYRNKGSASR